MRVAILELVPGSERRGYSALPLRGLMTMMNQALHLRTELDYLRPQP